MSPAGITPDHLESFFYWVGRLFKGDWKAWMMGVVRSSRMRDRDHHTRGRAIYRTASSVVSAAGSFGTNSIAAVVHIGQLAALGSMPGGGRRTGQGMGMDLWK